MKRYLVFAGKKYYPSGGFRDFVDDFGSAVEAESFAKSILGLPIGTPQNISSQYEWYEIVDSVNLRVILES